ncbi:MAG: TlpA family protein disulfide reductase [Chloroflexi bacterium]|nr:TlpA family protein disulfide reductase [Chloroflexota bacterium]OJV91739.1 MAG: hypothetical protein BGO39_17745 [Chloroflexi bacterium 54-19]
MKRGLFFAGILILLSLVLAACGEEAPQTLVREYAPRIGYLAPDFELKDDHGSPVKLSDYKGKPVLINFWATWCPPCRAEMPEIEAAYRKYQSQGLVVLGIDAREDIPTVSKYVADGGYSWTMPMDYNGEIIATYGVAAFPTSFFVDRDGFIRATQVGGMDKRGLEDRLTKIL